MNDYMACLDEKGNIIHLPEGGGILEQDDDKLHIIYMIQDEIRKYLASQIHDMKGR